MEPPLPTKEKIMPDHPQYLYRVSYGQDYGRGDRHGPTREFLNRDLAKQVFKADENGELHRVTSVCADGDTRHCDNPDCCSCKQEGPPNVPEFPNV